MSNTVKYEVNADTYPNAMASVSDMIHRGLQKGPVLVTLGRPKRSLDQNAKIHAMISDISRIEFEGKRYSSEVWKALLVDQFEQEAEGLSVTSRTVVSLDGKRAVTVRPSTTQFQKDECGDFVEFLYKFGSENGVEWSQ